MESALLFSPPTNPYQIPLKAINFPLINRVTVTPLPHATFFSQPNIIITCKLKQPSWKIELSIWQQRLSIKHPWPALTIQSLLATLTNSTHNPSTHRLSPTLCPLTLEPTISNKIQHLSKCSKSYPNSITDLRVFTKYSSTIVNLSLICTRAKEATKYFRLIGMLWCTISATRHN